MHLDFAAGVNCIGGENGLGKTTIAHALQDRIQDQFSMQDESTRPKRIRPWLIYLSDSSCGELLYGGTPWGPLIEYFRSRVLTDLERARLQIQNMTAEALHQLLGHKVARG